ncbi:MAG: hypothetical protein ABSE51_00300 [Terracidiphilus sp.]|jgi:hypothetical protein
MKQILALEATPIVGSIKYRKMRGHEAEIKPGMKLTATLAKEIPVADLEPNPLVVSKYSSGDLAF